MYIWVPFGIRNSFVYLFELSYWIPEAAQSTVT